MRMESSASRHPVTHGSFLYSGLSLAAFAIVCFAAAAVGAFFPPDEWYRGLNRPSYAPPNWVFGPVWTALYAMMAISAWQVWRRSGFAKATAAFAAFGLQLALNSIWSFLFFGRHDPGLALVDLVALWIAIAATIVLFARHSKTAALLLVPYLGWVSFAGLLNYGFWSLNR